MRLGRMAPRSLWSTLVMAGALTGATGVVIGIAAASSVAAASLGACGGSVSVAPGDSGSCSETVSDTSNSTSTPVDVSLVINTTSLSGGGSSGSGIATEAVLDGLPSGLQVTITDTSTGQTFNLGTISCYTDSTEKTPGTYPDAAYCASSSSQQTVATDVDNASFSNTFKISWSFPLGSGNPYQGSGATIQLSSTYTGTGTGSGTLGASTGPSGGQLAASTPTTGVQLPETLGQLLLGSGVLLILAGMFLYVRRQRNEPFEPPASS